MNQERIQENVMKSAIKYGSGSCDGSSLADFSMKMIMWNCKWMDRPSFNRVMKHIIKKHNPQIMAMLETRTISEHA